MSQSYNTEVLSTLLPSINLFIISNKSRIRFAFSSAFNRLSNLLYMPLKAEMSKFSHVCSAKVRQNTICFQKHTVLHAVSDQHIFTMFRRSESNPQAEIPHRNNLQKRDRYCRLFIVYFVFLIVTSYLLTEKPLNEDVSF